ncbi:MAG TPA: DUF4136 domain-containing protein [Bryobacteraceae bacterium]|nr:DUF4136 domain-containing protein [Bryobacteraceae bacterium]
MRMFGLMFLAASYCVSAQKVHNEFDETIDFSQYKTFTIREGQLRSKNPSLNNELVRKKIDAELRRRLTEKGLLEVTEKPDLNVRYSLGAANHREVDVYPSGWGTRRYVIHYTEGTLIIDLRDAKRRALVWRAIATEDKDSGAKVSEHLADMVKKAIEKYPPHK